MMIMRFHILLFSFLLLGAATHVGVGQIKIDSLDPPSIRPGKENLVVIAGNELNRVRHWAFSFEASCELVEQAADGKSLKLKIRPLNDLESGINLFRLMGQRSATTWQPISVDRLESFAAIPDQPLDLKDLSRAIAVEGQIRGQQKVRIEFEARKGQRFCCELESRRLGSRLRGEFYLFDDSKRQLAWSQPQRLLGGDSRLTYRIPKTGRYQLVLQDQLLKAPENSRFRIKLGPFAVVDQLVPKGNTWSTFRFDQLGGSSGELRLPTEQGQFQSPALLKNSIACTGWRPVVPATGYQPKTEAGLPGSQELSFPQVLHGQISTDGETDEFTFRGSGKIFVRVRAREIGSPLDAVVRVLDEKGKVISKVDDSGGSRDSVLELNLPGKNQLVRIQVSDLLGRGGQGFHYRLDVGNVKSAMVDLRFDRDHLPLTPGSHELLRVKVARNGFLGPIPLQLKNAEGLQYFPKQIPAGRNSTFVVFSTDTKVRPGSTMIRAAFTDSQNQLGQVAMSEQAPREFRPSWMNALLTFAPGSTPAYQLQVRNLGPLPMFPWLQRFELTVQRAPQANDALRLALETNQTVRMKTIQPKGKKPQKIADPATTVRLVNSKLDLAPDQNRLVALVFTPEKLSQKVDLVFSVRPI